MPIHQKPLQLQVKPPDSYMLMGPSGLFVYFRELTGWTLPELVTNIDEFLQNELGEGTVDAWASGNKRPTGIRRMAFLNFVQFHVVSDLKEQWRDAFIQCWANHMSEQTKQRVAEKGRGRKVVELAKSFFERHRDWIGEQNLKQILDEKFTLPDIYVPIKIIAHGVVSGSEEENQIFSPDYLYNFAMSGLETEPLVDWIFIKGGPGSGKSVLSIMLAGELTAQNVIQVAYLNMSRASAKKLINPDNFPDLIGDQYGVIRFLKYFKEHSNSQLVLILDGLDEIGGDSISTQQIVLDTLSEIQHKINDLDSFNKTIRVIVFGRESITEVAAQNFPKGSCKLFSMGDLSGKLQLQKKDENIKYDEDLRPVWWRKFVTARGYEDDQAPPQFLIDAAHPFFELGKEPLLAYLICRSFLPPDTLIDEIQNPAELLNDEVNGKNRNSIYSKVIEEVRLSQKWKSGRNSPVLPAKEYLEVLNYIALATWQEGSNRTATIRRILDVIPKEEIKFAFEKIITKFEDNSSSNLLTTFYYRITESTEERLEYEFEFTHKTFSEYLLATFLFDKFERLIDHQELGISDGDKITQQQEWIELVMAGPDSREIAKFILNEAELRYYNRSFNIWSSAFKIIREITSLSKISSEGTQPWLRGQGSILRLKRATAMVFLIWGALNKVRYEQTHEYTEFGVDDVIEGFDLELMCIPYNLEQNLNGVEAGNIEPETFIANALSGLYIKKDDLSGLYLNNGVIHGLKLEELNASFSIWHEINLTDFYALNVNFRNSRFSGSTIMDATIENCSFRQNRFDRFTLSQNKFRNCIFEQSDFKNATFNSCQFEDVVFNRSDLELCAFASCWFNNCQFEACLVDDELQFLGCEFINTNFESVVFKKIHFKNCDGVSFII